MKIDGGHTKSKKLISELNEQSTIIFGQWFEMVSFEQQNRQQQPEKNHSMLQWF